MIYDYYTSTTVPYLKLKINNKISYCLIRYKNWCISSWFRFKSNFNCFFFLCFRDSLDFWKLWQNPYTFFCRAFLIKTILFLLSKAYYENCAKLEIITLSSWPKIKIITASVKTKRIKCFTYKSSRCFLSNIKIFFWIFVC